jgi:hypothetical protein
MIFEHTMAAEQVPLDPRVFTHAHHATDTRRPRVARLKCNHWRGSEGVAEYVLSEWREDAEPWNYSDVTKRRENNRRYEFQGYGGSFFDDADTEED